MADLAEFRELAGKTERHLQEELARVHTGRPTSSLVDGIELEYHGVKLPIRSVATVTVPDASSIVITPWDRGNLATIERAIRESDLSLSPVNTGEVIRIAVPPLSEERRREYIRLVRTKVEEARVAVRNARRDVLGKLRREWEGANTPEDEQRRTTESLDKAAADATRRLDELGEAKARELSAR